MRGTDANLLRTLLIGLVGFLVASVFATMQKVSFLYLYTGLITIATGIVTDPSRTGRWQPQRPRAGT
jgi:hypothetical protein